jgi:OPA family glycerol-3-phosphate transporter-like MFS transporter
MQLLIVAMLLTYIITLYFMRNPMNHSKSFMMRRFISWFPMGMTYAFIYFARYNLDTLATAEVITKAQKSQISGMGFLMYALSLFLAGPLVDKLGGKKGMILASLGAAVFNGLMGLVLYLSLTGQSSLDLVLALTFLYSLNMLFQSFGAISTIKVKSSWFHVRERGTFGAIFGTLISLGVYFAFDWTDALAKAVNHKFDSAPNELHGYLDMIFGISSNPVSAYWLIFYIPAILLLAWSILDFFLVKDTPEEAGFGEFHTHDASHGGAHDGLNSWFTVIKMVFTNRILWMIGIIEFTSGVLRDGVMKWYRLYAKETGMGVENIMTNWGLWAAVTGIVGAFLAGWASDKFFHSRRAPVAGIAQCFMFVAAAVMLFAVYTGSPLAMGIGALVIMMAVIGVHSIMSGTATADFGGRKAAATATGVADGFSKLGSSFQEVALGIFITKDTWAFWPSFLIPFTLIGLFFAVKIWRELPAATKKYLEENPILKKQKM